MGSGMPEIGSRISLISKADIRYEGKLYSVDPEECTIALSSVRSYGTEDRETSYPVPAQNQVYDYILFRGTDIKDIRVLTTTIPNDPAIVQLSVPPSINDLQFQSQPGYPPPTMNSMAMPNVPSTSRGQSQAFQNAGFVPPATGNSNITHSIPKPQAVPNISEDESRSSTPSTQNAVQHKNADANRAQNVPKSDDQNQQQRRPNAYGQRDNRNNQPNRYQQQQKPQYQQRYPQQPQQQQQQQQQQRYPQQHQQQQQQRYAQQQRYPQHQRYMQPQHRDYRDYQYRNYNNYRDPYAPRQYQKWNNQRTGHPANQQQNYQPTAYQNRKPRNTLKFDGDYDFEQANSQFEEVKCKLASVKLDDTVKVNGDVEAKKEDSANEASGGEDNDNENEDKPIFYDKVKSFFDQISYEAIERSKGHTQRLDWKTERKINSETFGAVALRRNSNFRGRAGGNYYNNYAGNRNSPSNIVSKNSYSSIKNQNRGPPNNQGNTNDDGKENQAA